MQHTDCFFGILLSCTGRLPPRHPFRMGCIEVILPIVIHCICDDTLVITLPREHAEVVAGSLRGDRVIEDRLLGDREAKTVVTSRHLGMMNLAVDYNGSNH